MTIDLSKADEKNAKLTLKLRADSGFSSHGEYRVSANQWGEITAICEDGKTRQTMIAADDLLTLVNQYRNDLLYPPAGDSRQRRIEAIDAAISKALPRDGGSAL